MSPWEVIEEAMLRARPARGMKWLSEQLDERIQTVSNWKARGVPARRFREIGNALGLTVDQIEGLEPPPWEQETPELSPQVAELARAINVLPKRQQDFVLLTVIDALKLAQESLAMQNATGGETREEVPASSARRKEW